MKIAYVCTIDPFEINGVTQKISRQIKFWSESGNNVLPFCFVKNIPTLANNYLGANVYCEHLPFSRLYNPGKKYFDDIKAFKPDLIYMRGELFGLHIYGLRRLAPMVVEMNSDEVTEFRLLAQSSMKHRIRFIFHQLTRNYYFKNMAGLVSVTKEISDLKSIVKFDLPSVVIPNSVQLKTPRRIKKGVNSNKLSFLFLCTEVSPWHGLDKIVRLAEFLKGKAEIHVVGIDKVDCITESENLHFYGFLKPNEYEYVVEMCDVGIGTLALHRKSMNEACPLKVRDYIAYGLPVIIGYDDTAFIGSELPEWVLQIPNVENNVDMYVDDIYKFSIKMRDVCISVEEAEFYIGAQHYEKLRINFFEKICANWVCR